MSGKFSNDETLNTLKAIFEKHENERVCVIAAPCTGKTTLCKQLTKYNCDDLDDVLFPYVPENEREYLSELIDKRPWTMDNINEIYEIIYKYGKVISGRPLFTTTILECEVVIYIDISDDLLAKHCDKRKSNFEYVKNYKSAIENDWNTHKAKSDKMFYYLTVME